MSEVPLKRWIEKLKDSSSDVAQGLDEMHTLVRQDSARAYSFYERDGRHREGLPTRGLRGRFSVAKAVFLSFLRKLSPARRLAYVAGLVAFVWGYLEGDWAGAVVGFGVLNFLLALELAEKLLTKGELEIARSIQFSLCPVVEPHLANLEVSSYFRPAQDVGGDYYDFAQEGAQKLTVILGDVSGKGIPAALYAMKLQALFELLGKSPRGPRQILIEMNDVIADRIERNYFITAVIGVLDVERRRLVLARAGHNHPLHFAAATGELRWLKPDGVGIGMRKGPGFGGLLEESEVELGPGDVLVFYTDGVSEAMNAASEPFGYEKMENVLRESAHLGAGQIKENILSRIDEFRKDTPFADDATLVVTKIG